ncbi:MAG: hypothetical protein IJD12_01500 [Tidjanibacter sp.]|nr:hypothetical protein [Tidjanibacter sp.]MBQ3070350.1 hypothetical protein [Tidjanibacter sp.]
MIGAFTEKWCTTFFSDIAHSNNLYAISGVQCEELGLQNSSRADLAFCRKPGIQQKAEDIALIFEIKMGIVNNYKYNNASDSFDFVSGYDEHKGTPSLLRSDSMLKAIGKAVNIRMSGEVGRVIPIIILGNSPIGSSYINKVDNLCMGGIIQQFISLYPDCGGNGIQESPRGGFKTYNSYEKLANYIHSILSERKCFFSAMMSNAELGKLLEIANMEDSLEMKGQKFVDLISGE